MVKRGVTIQLNAEAEGSQRTQQRVDHSLSYTMKKKKDLINAECHHSIITRKTALQTGLEGFWGKAGLGTAGLEGGLVFPCQAQSGPWGALKRWPCDPTPHPDSVEEPGLQREDIILCEREGVEGGGP